MASKIISVSIKPEDFEYLINDGGLSPSKILQSSIKQIRENRSGLKEQIQIWQTKCRVMQERILIQDDEIQRLKEGEVKK